jgi:hypothetical protein|tara:strand:+ start:135 stop:1364 length:1230 start_codon:yes stop_codon:yes gene_type:complete
MPSIKDIIAGQSVGVGKRVIKAGADKLRGIINDRTGSNMPTFGTFDVKKLTYPMDVVDDPQQGHYIVFTVRKKSKEAVVDDSGAEEKKNPIAVTEQLTGKSNSFGKNALKGFMGGASFGNIQTFTNNLPGLSAVKAKEVKIAEQKIENYSAGESLDAKDKSRGHGESANDKQGKARFSLRPPTYRTSTMITLYMPPQVKNITGVTYKDQEMGAITTAVGSVIEGLTDEERAVLTDTDATGLGLGALLRKAGNMIGMDAKELFTLQTGKLISPRMEFIFDAVKKRVFTYQFGFYPKSEKEAQEVEKIIRTFRKNMLPKRMDTKQDVLALEVPNEFNIEYYYKGNENNFINKIGTCLLTDCDITYGGDKYATFKPSSTQDGEPGASPTEINMTVTFQEMDIITQEDVDEGF